MGSDTGVYVGVCGTEYQTRALARCGEDRRVLATRGPPTARWSGRLSYVLGLKGPNFPVDTACSSSLVAVHLACQGLRTRGVQPGDRRWGQYRSDARRHRVLQPAPRDVADGRCHTFSADADGYVRGEGCGMVVLKRLSDAQRDGDPILAVIRGSAVNQDGRSAGLTAPNGPSQQAVIREALRDGAGVSPARGRITSSATGRGRRSGIRSRSRRWGRSCGRDGKPSDPWCSDR